MISEKNYNKINIYKIGDLAQAASDQRDIEEDFIPSGDEYNPTVHSSNSDNDDGESEVDKNSEVEDEDADKRHHKPDKGTKSKKGKVGRADISAVRNSQPASANRKGKRKASTRNRCVFHSSFTVFFFFYGVI